MDLFTKASRARNSDRIYRWAGSPACDGCGGAEDHPRCPAGRTAAPASRPAGGGPLGPALADRTRQAATLPVRWKIVAGLKVIAEGETRDGVIAWPADLPGRLLPAASDRCRRRSREETPLIVAPPRAFGGDFDRCWLLAVQLYGVRSARNWGIGDFTDLEGLIELAAGLGADGVGLNPLHALVRRSSRPIAAPIRRTAGCFSIALYIDVAKLPGVSLPERADAIARLRRGDIVDYAGVAELKWQALRAAFAALQGRCRPAERRQDFASFRAEREPLLARFACFEVLRHKFNKPWWEWPEPWRQPDEAECAALREGPDARRDRIRRIRAMDRRPAVAGVPRSRAQARHEGRALSRCRRRRAVRRVRCLERAGGDLAPSRRRRAAGRR